MTIREELEKKYNIAIQSGVVTLPNYQFFKMYEIYFENPVNFWTTVVNAPSFDLFCIDTLIEASSNLKKIFDLTFENTSIEKVLKSFPNGSLTDFFISLRNQYRYNKHKRNMQAFQSNKQTINFIFGKICKSILDSWTKEEKAAFLIEEAGVNCSQRLELPNRIGEYQSMSDVKQAIDFINLTRDEISLSYKGAKDLNTLFYLKDKYRTEEIPTKFATGLPSFYDEELIDKYARLVKKIKPYESTAPLMVNIADLLPQMADEDAKFTRIFIYQVGTITTIESVRKDISNILYLDDVGCRYLILDEKLNRFKSVAFAGNSTLILNNFNNYTELCTRGQLLVKGNNVLKAEGSICCNIITDPKGCSVVGLPENVVLMTGEELPEAYTSLGQPANAENILTMLYPVDRPGSAALSIVEFNESGSEKYSCDTIEFSNTEIRVPALSKLTTIDCGFKFVSNVTLADVKGNLYPNEDVEREIRKREVKKDILGGIRLTDGNHVFGFDSEPVAVKLGESPAQAAERAQEEDTVVSTKPSSPTEEQPVEETSEARRAARRRNIVIDDVDNNPTEVKKPSGVKRLH